MANSDARRMAADARRVSAKRSEDETAKAFRESFRENYERGRAQGREEMREELQGVDTRTAMLNVLADGVEAAGSRISSIPNSENELRACREAEGILRDAAKSVTPRNQPEEPEAEEEPKKATGKKRRKS